MNLEQSENLNNFFYFENLTHGTSRKNAHSIKKNGYKISKSGLVGKGFYLWSEEKKYAERLALDWACENHEKATHISCLFFSVQIHTDYFYDLTQSKIQSSIYDIMQSDPEYCERIITNLIESHLKEENLSPLVIKSRVPIEKNFHYQGNEVKKAYCLVLRAEKNRVKGNKSVLKVEIFGKIRVVKRKVYLWKKRIKSLFKKKWLSVLSSTAKD